MQEIEIEIESEEDITQLMDQEHVSVDKINHEFVQEDKLKGQLREYMIFNDIYCNQSVRKKHGNQSKYRVNLTYIDPQPQREFILAKSWLITATVGLVISLMLVYLGWFSPVQFDNRGILTIVTAVAFTACILAFLVAILRTHDRILFYSQNGRVPLLEFFNKKPDAESFDQFIQRLSRYIQLAQKLCKYNTNKCLTLELQELRRLQKEHVITEQQYEQGKQQIFNHQAFKA